MITLELFSGTKSFSKVAAELGHETFTVDIEPKLNPDLVCDILDFKIEMLPEKFRKPDIVWASPPCTKFSVMTIARNWRKEGEKYFPKNQEAINAQNVVKKTLEIIKEINPTYYFIENPRGMLRKQDFMQDFPRNTVTYCQYGFEYQKATDIWTNCKQWIPRPKCSPKSPCHVRAARGSRFGVQGTNGLRRNRPNQKHLDTSMITKRRNGLHADFTYDIDRKTDSALARGVIPPALFHEIFKLIGENK